MFLTLEKLLQLPHNPKTFACKPLLPQHGIMFIGAEAKAMKSWVAMNMAYELAEGQAVMGLFGVQSPQRVLYFDQELGLDEMKRRLAKIHAHRKGVRADRNLMVISKDRACKLDSDVGLATIKKYIADAKADVIVLDPLICFHTRDENDNTEMHKVLEAIAGLGCAVIVLHHFGKPSETRHGSNPSRARGASTIWGDCDTFISISRPDSNDRNRLMLEYSLRFDTEPCPTKMDWNDETGVFTVMN